MRTLISRFNEQLPIKVDDGITLFEVSIDDTRIVTMHYMVTDYDAMAFDCDAAHAMFKHGVPVVQFELTEDLTNAPQRYAVSAAECNF